MTMFREGVYHAMPWTRAAVDAAAVYRMRLTGAPAAQEPPGEA
jgi:hypothetical protein